MPIHELIAVVLPPKTPLEIGTAEQWVKVQKELGIELPVDLCDFGMQYGSGVMCESLHVLNPFAGRFQENVKSELETLELAISIGGSVPYDRFPSRPGLFPWAWDENGYRFYWLTVGAKERWRIVIATEEEEYEEWSMSMTSFLAKAFTNEISSFLSRPPILPSQRTFRPITKYV